MILKVILAVILQRKVMLHMILRSDAAMKLKLLTSFSEVNIHCIFTKTYKLVQNVLLWFGWNRSFDLVTGILNEPFGRFCHS